MNTKTKCFLKLKENLNPLSYYLTTIISFSFEPVYFYFLTSITMACIKSSVLRYSRSSGTLYVQIIFSLPYSIVNLSTMCLVPIIQIVHTNYSQNIFFSSFLSLLVYLPLLVKLIILFTTLVSLPMFIFDH